MYYHSFTGILVGVVNGPVFGISATTLALYDVVYAVNTAQFRFGNSLRYKQHRTYSNGPNRDG